MREVTKLPQENPASRKLIELVRRGFHAVGVDFHRHRPDGSAPLQSADIFKGLLALRDLRDGAAAGPDEVAFLEFCVANHPRSHAQLMQDLFVLYECRSKRAGYFVEFGATDGVEINNTVLLEREFGWTGVLAEPAHSWHGRLKANRHCSISTDCVWRATGEKLLFNETPEGEYSTLAALSSSDGHALRRAQGSQYEVSTISLMDLLRQAHAPRCIEYLSIDTEGSELDILAAFDFGQYKFDVITVEHNYTPNRERLYELLTAQGYSRKFEAFSQWDDWYVRAGGGAT
jgi:FkbM family methyltransferase